MAHTLTLTRQFRFEMAHQLPNYIGPCANLHGHSYRLDVTISGEPAQSGPTEGMVMDFHALKQIVEEAIIAPLDHALMLRRNSQIADQLKGYTGRLVLVDYQPTCENMLLDFANRLRPLLPPGVTLDELTLAETQNSSAAIRLR